MPNTIRRFSRIFLVAISCCFLFACQQQASKTSQLDTKLFNPANNAVLGNPAAKVTVVEFFDYNCPDCKRSAATVAELVKDNPNVKVVFKEYNLFGPVSQPATAAALAANLQGKYLTMHNALLAKKVHRLSKAQVLAIAGQEGLDVSRLKQDMVSATIVKQVKANKALAKAAGIKGTPSFVIGLSVLANKHHQADLTTITNLGNPGLAKLEKLIAKVSAQA